MYVQALLSQKKDMIVKALVEDKGHFYICGNTKMGLEVQVILKEFLGEDQMKDLEKSKRLIKEMWG